MQFLDLSFWHVAVRGIMALLCRLIYPLISWLFTLFMNIAKVNILSTKDVEPIYQRVTMILTIVMVFYVTFEMVKYVVQPEGITDKEKGAGKLIYRIMMVIVMLAFVPKIFTWGMQFQTAIIDKGIVGKVIVGNQSTDPDEFGGTFSASLFQMFYNVEEKYVEEKCEGIRCGTLVEMNLYTLQKAGTLPYLTTGLNESIDEETTMDGETVEVALINFSFDGLLAVIVGGFVVYILALYCIDVGVRWAQLIFLQIIAPIPIIGFLAPQKEGIFQKWAKQCISTYIDLFLRIAIIYFVLLISSVLLNARESGDLFANLNVSDSMEVFIYIILILGVMLFAKKAPDLLKELFPKMSAASGNFGLKFGDRTPKLAARAAGAALGSTRAIGGMIGRAASRAIRNRANKETAADSKKARDAAKEARNKAKSDLKTAERDAAQQRKVQAAKEKVRKAADAYKNAKTDDERARRKKELDIASADYRKVLEEKRNQTNSPETQAAKQRYVQNRETLRAAQKELQEANESGDKGRIAAAKENAYKAQVQFDQASKAYTEELRKDRSGAGKHFANLIDKKQEAEKYKEEIETTQKELDEAKASGDNEKIEAAQTKLNDLEAAQKETIEKIQQETQASQEATKLETQMQKTDETKTKAEEDIERYDEQYDEANEIYQQTKYRSVLDAGLQGAIKGGITGAWTGAHATNLKEVFTKTGEAWKKDADAIRKENAYVDNGGAQGIGGIIDKIDSKIARTVGYDTAYERRMLDSKNYDVPIKAIDSRMSLTKDAATTIGSGEDRLKSKISELKTSVAGRQIDTGLKDANGNKIYADTTGCNTIGDLSRKYDALAATAKSEADTAAKSAEELAMEAAKETNQTEKAKKEKLAEEAKQQARDKAIAARNAEYQAEQLKKYAARDAYTQMLAVMQDDKENNTNNIASPQYDQVAVQEIKKAMNSISLAAKEPKLREDVRKILQETFPDRAEHLYQAFITGKITTFDDIDDIKTAIINAENKYGDDKKKLQEDKRYNETSISAQKEKAADDFVGNGGK